MQGIQSHRCGGRRAGRVTVAAAVAVMLGAVAAGEAARGGGDDPVPECRALRERLVRMEPHLPGPPAGGRGRAEWANFRFHFWKALYLLDGYEPCEMVLELARESVAEAGIARRAWEQDLTQWPDRRGLREEAYHADNDDSFQPFLSYLPHTARPSAGFPLVVYLHGYSPTMNRVNWRYVPSSLAEYAEETGSALVVPFGRGSTDFQGIGEQDVLRAVCEMESRYPIDSDRILLTGFSMGGMGAWTLAAHYPHRFAGLLVVGGRGDYYFWHGVKPETLPMYKRDLIDADFGFPLRLNLAELPVWQFHGARDVVVPTAEGRYMARGVREINPRARYTEVPNMGHHVWGTVLDRKDVREWMRACRRRVHPNLRYIAYHPNYRNEDARRLRPARCGPVKNAFLSPFALVTSRDDNGRDLFRRAVEDWRRYGQAPPRVREADRVGPHEKGAYNLFLFGGPEKNPLVREVLADSPVRVSGDTIYVGKRRHSRAGHGLWVVRPSPWDSRRLVVVQCGVPWGEGLPFNHKYDFIPDYIVYTADQDRDGSNRARCAGFFDREWKIDRARIHTAPPIAVPNVD